MKNIYLPLVCAFFSIQSYSQELFASVSNPFEMETYNNRLYVISDDDTILKINLDSDPPVVETVLSQSEISGLQVVGSDLYYSLEFQNKISKLDLTVDPHTSTDLITQHMDRPTAFEIIGNDLYVMYSLSSYETINKFNLLSPNSPPDYSIAPTFKFVTGMASFGNDLYIADIGEGKIFKVDVSVTPATKTHVFTDLWLPYDVKVIGDELYITHGQKLSRVNLGIGETMASLVYDSGVFRSCIASNGDNIYTSSSFNDEIYEFTESTLVIDERANKIGIYPNPTANSIKISNIEREEAYSIYTIIGKEVLNGVLYDEQEIDVNSLTNGLYILRLESGKISTFIKY